MRDENQFPTMRFLTCRVCGHSYTASLSGSNACPNCRAPARPSDEAGNRISRVEQGGHILLILSAPMYKLKDLEELKTHVDAVLQADPRSLAFHLDGASYLDSSMLAQLVRAVQELTKRGRTTYVISSDPQVIESLEILDLDRVLTLLPNLDAYRAVVA
jgi:anti-anti-sigma factor